jgi:hypothetical protein
VSVDEMYYPFFGLGVGGIGGITHILASSDAVGYDGAGVLLLIIIVKRRLTEPAVPLPQLMIVAKTASG